MVTRVWPTRYQLHECERAGVGVKTGSRILNGHHLPLAFTIFLLIIVLLGLSLSDPTLLLHFNIDFADAQAPAIVATSGLRDRTSCTRETPRRGAGLAAVSTGRRQAAPLSDASVTTVGKAEIQRR